MELLRRMLRRLRMNIAWNQRSIRSSSMEEKQNGELTRQIFLVLQFVSRYLSFCPKKNNETGEDFIGAYLGLIDCDFCFSASFRLGISKTEKDFIIFTKLNKESKDWTGRNGWGNLIKYEKLFDPKNEFINNGQLTLFCDVRKSQYL